MQKKQRVFIDGREGTTGLRIFSRLEQREDLEVVTLPEELRKDPAARQEMILGADIAFLCLPDEAARESVALAEAGAAGAGVKIIDTSTAHRTAEGWSYGFPELSPTFRRGVVNGTRVAVPGCHASGFIALAYPLIAAGIISPDCPITCFSVTGYSGGGKKMIEEYEAADRSEALGSPRQYGLSQAHKHLKEMTAVCGLSRPPIFSPVVADFYSGMVVTLPIHTALLEKPLGPEGLREVYRQAYDGAALIRVRPSGGDEGSGFVAGNGLSGFDAMEIAVEGNPDRVLLTARFDNLGKGASGAAIQCLNLMTGVPETTGLVI